MRAKFCQLLCQSPVKKNVDYWMIKCCHALMVDDASSPCTTTAKARVLTEAWNHRKESGFQFLREGVSIPARSTTQLPEAKHNSKAAASVVNGKIAWLCVQLLVATIIPDNPTLIAKVLFLIRSTLASLHLRGKA